MRSLAPINRLVLLLLLVSATGLVHAAEEGEHHPHHLAVGTGVAWHDSKSSVYLGVDYLYNWENGWGVGGFYEEVSGDFDLQVWGVLFSRKFGHGWKFNFGPGVERKLKKNKSKTLAVFRTQLGYDWHRGNWSFGPLVTVDLIEDGNTTYYAGFTVGYGW